MIATPSHARSTLTSRATRGASIRCVALVLALVLPLAAAAQAPAPLSKSDLVRYLSSNTYSTAELAGIVRRSCLTFTPTARDRDDLRALGATGDVMDAIDACAKPRKQPSVPARSAGTTPRQTRPAAPPLPLHLVLPQATITAPAGSVVSLEAEVRRGGAPASGVRLMLHGVDRIPGGARQALVASTDASGRVAFPLPAGTTVGTYRLTVEAADDAEIQGDDAVALVTTAANPTSAEVSPAAIQLTGKTPAREEVAVILRDPFGNAAAFQRVELRPAHTITGVSTLSATTDDSGVVRFQLPTAPLHNNDTLVVAVGDRVLSRLPVSASGQVTTQLLEAARLVAEGRPADAEAMYDSVLQAEPNNVRALLARGAVRSLERKDQTARQDFLTVLHIDSTNTDALNGLGYSFARSGEYARAQRQFEKALRISPEQPDAATGLAYATLWQYDPRQATRRFDVLDALRPAAYPADAATRFRAGVDQLQKRNLPTAQYSFSAAIAAAPNWPDAYYNRALVYEAEGRPEKATPDLQKYLQLRPAARDRDAVARHIDALGVGSPSAVFKRGLIVPGLGQLSTGRPAVGIAVMAGVVGSAAWALSTHTELETRQFTDPFGNPYTDQVPVARRPHLTTGVALAGTVWVLGALEAYLHARNAIGGSSELPTSTGRTAQSAVGGPHVVPVMSFGPLGPAFGAGLAIPFR